MICAHVGNKTGKTGAQKHLMDWICDDCNQVIEVIDRSKDPLYAVLMDRLESFKLLEHIYVEKALDIARNKLGTYQLDHNLESAIKDLAQEDYANNPELQTLRNMDA
jgi:hypothetical protein